MKTPEELRAEFTAIPSFGNVQDFDFVYCGIDDSADDAKYYPLSILKDTGQSEDLRYCLQATLLNLANKQYGYDLHSANTGTKRFKVFTSGLVIEEETSTEQHTAFTLKLERIV